MINEILKLIGLLPGRRERMLNRIDAIKREMCEIQTKPGRLSDVDIVRLVRFADELSILQAKANRA